MEINTLVEDQSCRRDSFFLLSKQGRMTKKSICHKKTDQPVD
jgi:hypothetical protein